MWPFPDPTDLFGGPASAVVGWAWEKVIQGIYTWFGNGLLLLMEWVWRVLDSATTPRLTEPWFTTGLVQPLAALSVGIVIALMLASAVQAGFAGRPELVADAFKEGPKAIVATALTVTVMDVLLRGADVLAEVTWLTGRADTQQVLDGLARTITTGGPLASTFVAPLVLLFGMLGLLVTSVVLFMRSALLYLVAGFAPIVWAAGVSPVLRGAGRKLVQVSVALVLAKPAIALTLVVGAKLTANTTAGPATADGAAALGTLVTGFACFAIGGLSPWVVYRLLPAVEHASVGSGIVGGWGRAAMTTAQTAMMVKSLGATGAASAATRAVPGMSAGPGPGGGAGGGSGVPSSGRGSPPPPTGGGAAVRSTPTAGPASRRPATSTSAGDGARTGEGKGVPS